MKKGNGVVWLLMICVLMISGCAKTEQNQDRSEHVEPVYEQAELDFPEEFTNIISVASTTDDSIRVAFGKNNYNANSIWELNQQNGEWTKIIDLHEKLNLSEDSWCSTTLANDGKIFVEYVESVDTVLDIYASVKKYCSIDESGVVTDLEIILPELDEETKHHLAEEAEVEESITNAFKYCKFQGDELFGVDYGDVVYRIDIETGLINGTYKLDQDMGYVLDIYLDGEELSIVSSAGISTYLLSTGEIIIGEIEEIMGKAIANGEIRMEDNILLEDDAIEGKAYLCTGTGVYTYDKESKAVKMVMDSSGTALYGIDSYLSKFVVHDKEQFYIVKEDLETFQSSLYKYSRKENTKELTNTKELKVWALRDNTDIRNIISNYKVDNPNININIEFGLSDEDGMTISDAISNLNTKLLAGDAPDVLFLDQVPIEKYIDQGLLLDLSDVLKEIDHETPTLQNITTAFERNGLIHAIPGRFILIGATGTKSAIEQSGDLESLVQFSKEISTKDDSVPVFEKSDISSVIQVMYYSEMENFIEGDKVQPERIEEFFAKILALCEANNIEAVSLGSIWDEPGLTVEYYNVGVKKKQLSYDYIDSIGYQLPGMRGVALVIDGQYQLPSLGFEKKYMPTIIVGVNAKSNYIDEAKDFVKMQFSDKIQRAGTGMGLAVNRAEFEKALILGESLELEYEEGIVFDIKELTEDERNRALELVEQLEVPMVRNGVLMRMFYEQIEAAVSGQVSEREAVDNLIKKVDLYLAEQ